MGSADGHELEFVEGVGLAVFGQTTLNPGFGAGASTGPQDPLSLA